MRARWQKKIPLLNNGINLSNRIILSTWPEPREPPIKAPSPPGKIWSP